MSVVQAFVRYFFRGLLVVAPAGVTIYVIYVALSWLDRLLDFESRFGFRIPGLGVLLVIVAITLIGWVASRTLARYLIDLVEGILGKLPFVRLLYSSIKDLIEAFVGERKGFRRPVLVTLQPGDGPRVLGFVTRTDLDALGLPGHVAVYVPGSYSMAGHLVVVPQERTTPVAAESTAVMTFVVSGGVSGPGARPEPA